MTPPRGPGFFGHARLDLIKESQRQNGLVIALDSGRIINIAGTGLHVIKDVVFAQPAIADDVDAFNESLLRVLGVRGFRESQ